MTAFASPLALFRQTMAATPYAFLKTAVAGSELKSIRPVKQTLLLDVAASRTTANMAGTAELLSAQTDPADLETILRDLLDMQSEVSKETWRLGQNWFAGLQALGAAAFNMRAANTVSKFVEQDFNLVGRFGELVTKQVTDAIDLAERANVGYAYWLTEKLEQIHAGRREGEAGETSPSAATERAAPSRALTAVGMVAAIPAPAALEAREVASPDPVPLIP